MSDFENQSELTQALWNSDEASALTNQAARRIEELEGLLGSLVGNFSLDGEFNTYTCEGSLKDLLIKARTALPQFQKDKAKAESMGFRVEPMEDRPGSFRALFPNDEGAVYPMDSETEAWLYAISEIAAFEDID